MHCEAYGTRKAKVEYEIIFAEFDIICATISRDELYCRLLNA